MVKSVLFVCLGNICRSPIAEAVFLHLIEENGVKGDWKADSAAIGPWHVGNGPDKRAMNTLKNKNITYSHKARQVKSGDFTEFDFIFGMDDENIYDLERMKPSNSTAKIELLGCYDPEGELIIEDPYYQKGELGFIKCYEQCMRACKAYIDLNK